MTESSTRIDSVHLIGICGTGMGALAGLLAAKGYRVTGSDSHAYPPMSDELRRMGIEVMEGYRAENLDHNPDVVVVGNVCRPDHPEATVARDRGLTYQSMPRTINELFLKGNRSLVIAGTHGKTTTTALTAYFLDAAGLAPSFLAGGVLENFGVGYRVGNSDLFVIEGDEYDSAYFEKVAKFMSYEPTGAVITSVEHDHIDIYPTFDAYKGAFEGFSRLLEPGGTLAVYAGDPIAVDIAKSSRAAIVTYATSGDEVPNRPDWEATLRADGSFALRADGVEISKVITPMIGRHNLRNTLAAMIICHRVAGVSLEQLAGSLPGFKGVRRRQQVLGAPNDVVVYDDFAHHPTAVRETLAALATRPRKGRLIVAFEPRSATACRSLHQQAYVSAFDDADRIILAPPGRDLPEGERLDTAKICKDLRARGLNAEAADNLEQVHELVLGDVKPGDAVAYLSNGAFGGLAKRLVEALS